MNVNFPKASLVFLALATWTKAASLNDFQGSWSLDRKRSQNVTEAIDATIEPLNFVVRSVARTRLQKTNHPAAQLIITISETHTSINYGNKKSIASPSDGKSITWTREDGETAEVSTRLVGSMLQQSFKGADGQKSNRFQLSPDNKELILETQVSSPKLPKPLIYKTVYRREP